MRLQEILNQPVATLHTMRDEVCMEMVEATGKQLKQLENKLAAIEEAIYVKGAGYESKENKEI